MDKFIIKVLDHYKDEWVFYEVTTDKTIQQVEKAFERARWQWMDAQAEPEDGIRDFIIGELGKQGIEMEEMLFDSDCLFF